MEFQREGNPMYRTILVASAALVMSGFQGTGAAQPNSTAPGPSASAVHTAGFEEFRFTRATAIPDVPTGVVVGPLPVANDAATIQDVVLELSISHPYAGDIDAWLYYDMDDDGTYDAGTPIELYLARSGMSSPHGWGCPVELDGTYYFRYERDTETLTGWDTGKFESFRGLRGGGSFYLRVVDAVEGEVGTIEGWAVHVSSDPTTDVAFTRDPTGSAR
jgi:subtilisin-like proprotein convertase family protein